MREKVGKSRFTVFFQCFVAPEGRKVGSLKRRVRSQLARGEMKNCTPLWREAHFQVKMYKAHHVRTTLGSWHVEKVHAVVARSTFPSQNAQNTPGADHFWHLRCRKSARRCGAKHISKSKCTKHTTFGPLLEVGMLKKCTPLWREAHFQVKMHKTHQVWTTFDTWDVEKVHAVVARSTFPSQNVQNTPRSELRCRKSARSCGAKHISKWKCTKHTRCGPLLEVEMSKKCTPLWREAHFQVKMLKTLGVSDHFWTFRCRFASVHYITLHSTTLHCTTLHYITKHYNYNYTTTLPYTPLHSTTINHTTLHYTTLHYTTLHYTTLPSSTLHYITLHYTPLQLHNYTTTTTTTQLHSTTIHSTTLNCTTRHYTTLHYTTLHYTTPHYTTLHYLPLHFTTLHYTTLHYTTTTATNTQLHSTTLHYTKLHYTTLHYTTLHYIPLHSTTLHYTTLHYTEWHCTTDRHVDR